jgi:hypothetical protein
MSEATLEYQNPCRKSIGALKQAYRGKCLLILVCRPIAQRQRAASVAHCTPIAEKHRNPFNPVLSQTTAHTLIAQVLYGVPDAH